ncbi:cytochrome c oxidase assembly protein [Lutibaculum baratangense]|uniref:Cytochrome c oxidase assembly protein CtaG n=1 Tax=Lutibaculum baratangense AMV1 TaxID=631454 RepID=V4RFL7_9HYPH|nr:cytochrome c oxidase assembly protein [Lutibaculum baratangense]ESR24936.1 Cytochrome oxidase biogenesis protein Cox11-CtaG, copper delivery to Cox1 [Lutibaculum baratangense AMV1]
MSDNEHRRKNRKAAMIASVCGFVVVGMVGMSYAAVPLYDLFCRVTGYGGTTQRAEAASDAVLDREITIRFDSNVARTLAWTVEPEVRRMKLRIGETGNTFYLATNVSDGDLVGTSTFNVSPPQAGLYFNKIECFCFTEQPLGAGEDKEMGVAFFVDPAIMEDADARGLSEITLSYTFFPVRGQDGETQGAARPAGETTKLAAGGAPGAAENR